MILKNMRRKITLLWLIIGFMVFVQQSYAVTEQEYEVLTELSRQLDNLYPLIVEGKLYQVSNDRILLDWDELWNEIMVIQQGILDGFNPRSTQARSMPLLEGDYLK